MGTSGESAQKNQVMQSLFYCCRRGRYVLFPCASVDSFLAGFKMKNPNRFSPNYEKACCMRQAWAKF